MNELRSSSAPRSRRPFGEGLHDEDLRVLVASTDIRYRQTLRAVIVRRREAGRQPFRPLSAELIVLGTPENLATLGSEARALDSAGRLGALVEGRSLDAVLRSQVTGERVMITAMGPEDFERVERVAGVEQITIGAHGDRGAWVCRLIAPEQLDALFGGRVIDLHRD